MEVDNIIDNKVVHILLFLKSHLSDRDSLRSVGRDSELAHLILHPLNIDVHNVISRQQINLNVDISVALEPLFDKSRDLFRVVFNTAHNNANQWVIVRNTGVLVVVSSVFLANWHPPVRFLVDLECDKLDSARLELRRFRHSVGVVQVLWRDLAYANLRESLDELPRREVDCVFLLRVLL